MIAAMDLPTLDSLIAFATQVRAEKHASAWASSKKRRTRSAKLKLNGHRGAGAASQNMSEQGGPRLRSAASLRETNDQDWTNAEGSRS